MIGIIGAMDEEVAMLKEKLTEVQVETKAAMDFYKGKLEAVAEVCNVSDTSGLFASSGKF